MTQEQADLEQCIANHTPVVGFVADAAWPEITASNIWQVWWRLEMKQELPPGCRVLCSVSLPSFT